MASIQDNNSVAVVEETAHTFNKLCLIIQFNFQPRHLTYQRLSVGTIFLLHKPQSILYRPTTIIAIANVSVLALAASCRLLNGADDG